MIKIALNTLLAASVDPNMILTVALGVLSVLLFIMLLVEKGRTKRAEARASRLSAEARKNTSAAEPEAKAMNGAIHTVKELSPTEIEFDSRIDPSPMGVIAKREADDEGDYIPSPTIVPKKNPDAKYENRLTVEEAPVWASAPKAPVLRVEELDEEPVNDNVYSDDMLLINERDADDGDIIIVPKAKKEKKKKTKLLKNRKKLVNSVVIEESYEPLLNVEKEEKPEEAPENTAAPDNAPKAIEKAAEAAPEAVEEDKPSVLDRITDTLSGIASAFSAIADMAPGKRGRVSLLDKKDTPDGEKQLSSDVADEAAEVANPEATEAETKPEAAAPEAEPTPEEPKPPKTLEEPTAETKAVMELAKKAAKYADPEDMFERFPYKQPVNIEPNDKAFADSVTVGTKLDIQMTERNDTKAPIYINVGSGNTDDKTLSPAVREGEVELNVFLNEEIENELEEAKRAAERESSYEVESALSPDAQEYTVTDANEGKASVYTVEDAAVPNAIEYGEEGTKKVEDAPTSPLQEMIVVEEIPKAQSDEASYLINGEVVQVRYRSSFASRLIQAPTEVQEYYGALKNEILAYDGIKVKNSWNYESFNREGEQCIKLNVRGRSVMIYLALNPSDYADTKYRFKDMSGTPKFEKVPMLLSVRTERGLKYATELIADVMKKFGAARGELPTVDYRVPYEENSALALRGLVKLILPDGVTVDKNSEIVPVDVGDFISGEKTK